MLKNQRHTEIIEILTKQGFAGVAELGEKLFASQPTIRRDLAYLEKQGYVVRNHGGAVLANGKANTPIPFRRGTRTKEKKNICRLAATLIRPDRLIFIDASTTAFFLSDHIDKADNVTVVTNGLPLCSTLGANGVRTFSTGGRVFHESEALIGSQAERTVTEYNADIMFFSASSFDLDGMITDYCEEENDLRRIMRAHAKEAVFLCDSGKFGTRSAFSFFDIGEIDYLVTDCAPDTDTVKRLGLKLLLSDDGARLYRCEKSKCK